MTYVELHCHSNYSFLDGASHPESLARRAAELGMDALAITDHQGVYGAVKFAGACRASGVRPIFGAEIDLTPVGPGARRPPATGSPTPRPATSVDRPPSRSDPDTAGRPSGVAAPAGLPGGHLTLLVESAAGWANLCRILTAAGLAGAKHQRPVPWDLLERHAAGLVCLSGCRDGVVAAAARRGDRELTLAAARRLKAIFGPDKCYVEIQRHLDQGDARLGATLVALAEHLGLPLVATNNVHYAAPDDFRLQHVLACVRQHTTLDDAGTRLYATAHRYLKADDEMDALFPDLPEAVASTARVADRCRFDLDFAHARLPAFPVPGGETPFSHLLALCQAGLRRRYDPVTPAANARLARELSIIEDRRLAEYFLLVHDIVAFARARGIRCQGRGSAAGSLVAYVLGITPVDPIAHDLLFDRFLAEGSRATPDIDVDFAASRREEVIQYVYRRYGAAHTAMVANVVTFHARSAVADVGKALGFPADLLGEIRAHLHVRSAHDIAPDLSEVDRFAPRMAHLPWRLLVDMCAGVDRFPRHLSIHPGGMLVTGAPLTEVVPLEPATMPGRVVVQWDKDDVEDAGLIKIDLLSLRTLDLVDEAFDHVRSAGGPDLAIDTVPEDDPDVWRMLQAADAVGCFQVESRAQMNLLPRLRPTGMRDLIVEVALIRPGPVQGGMCKAYLARRDGEEAVTYWHPSLEPALAETLGIIVFQEQVLRVAMDLAGFSGAQADLLRRSMSRKRSYEAMEDLRAEFVVGARERGVDPAIAETVFTHLLGFAAYGFCKSHAAAFAQLSYVTAWLKCHHPLAFYCALLNAQPMGFYSVATVVEDARRHGISPLPLDINHSEARWTIEGQAVRVPLLRLKGMPEAVAHRIVRARVDAPFADLWDFVRRARPPRAIAERLVLAGALDALAATPADAPGPSRSSGAPPGTIRPSKGPRPPGDRRACADRPGDQRSGGDPASTDRRQLLWALGEMHWDEGGLDLPSVVAVAPLPTTTVADAVAADNDLLGLAQGPHLLALLRPQLAQWDVATSAELHAMPGGVRARVAGRLEVLQLPPPAKGIAFAALEDEHGLANLLFYPDAYARNRHALRISPIVVAEGVVQHEKGALHLVTDRVVPVRIDGTPDTAVPDEVLDPPGDDGVQDGREG